MAAMLGMPDINTDEMTKKLEEILPVIKQVNEQFKNPVSNASPLPLPLHLPLGPPSTETVTKS